MPEAEVITLTSLMKPGHTAVVTGASSGIGRAASLAFAKAGMNVFMIDIDKEELSLAQRLVKSNALLPEQQIIVAEVMDVSNARLMQVLAEQVYDATRKCHILFNNAGTGLGGGALTSIETLNHVVQTNAYGPIHGCLAFVPRMKESGEPGIIINTGSKQGITCPPGNLSYNMSKAMLKVYTEGLEHELMLDRLDGHGKLRAVLLIPGWVNTSIVLKTERHKVLERGEKFDIKTVAFHEEKPHEGAWMPSQVVEFMVEEVDKGRFYVLCPDNEVDRETDNLRILYAAQDITENRPPLSRWHPDFAEHFTSYLHAAKGAK